MIQTSARLLQLLGLFQGGRAWTAPALAAELQVEARTIRRDVDRLRELGYPIESRRGRVGGYHLGHRGQLPPLLLDEPEALAVAIGLRSAAVESVAGAKEAAARALVKLDQVTPPSLRATLSAMDAGLVTVAPGTVPVSGENLAAVLKACDARTRLRFRYRSGVGSSSDRDTEPHRLVQAGRRWYLLAWDVDRADWRTFRADRMTDVRPSTFLFAGRELPGDAAVMVANAVSTAPYRYQARVLVEAGADRLAELVPPTVGVVLPTGPDQCLLVTGSDSLTSLALHLVSLDHRMQVLEPHELIELFGRLGRRLTDVHRRSAAGVGSRTAG